MTVESPTAAAAISDGSDSHDSCIVEFSDPEWVGSDVTCNLDAFQDL